MSARSDHEWPEGLTEDRDNLFLSDKLLVPETRSRRSSTTGTTQNIRAATRCNEILNGGLSSLLDITQS